MKETKEYTEPSRDGSLLALSEHQRPASVINTFFMYPMPKFTTPNHAEIAACKHWANTKDLLGGTTKTNSQQLMTLTQQAANFTQHLETLETQLTEIIGSSYYQQLSATGFYIVEVNLADALQAVKETAQIHEQIVTILTHYPDDGLKQAITKALEPSKNAETPSA